VLQRQEMAAGSSAEPVMIRDVIFAGESGPVTHKVPVYERAALHAGEVLTGPAIITQYDTTTVVPPEWSVRVDAVSNLILEGTAE
jgi:N-methylhydantoinase A